MFSFQSEPISRWNVKLLHQVLHAPAQSFGLQPRAAVMATRASDVDATVEEQEIADNVKDEDDGEDGGDGGGGGGGSTRSKRRRATAEEKESVAGESDDSDERESGEVCGRCISARLIRWNRISAIFELFIPPVH
jgi:hypothetical protein